MASNATAEPRADKGGWNSVHGLFHFALAFAVVLGVAWGVFRDRPGTAIVEFGARIVVTAAGKGLGTMAKAGQPIGVVRSYIPPG